METTRLSSKGQVIIPKRLRDAHHWLAGQELIAIAQRLAWRDRYG